MLKPAAPPRSGSLSQNSQPGSDQRWCSIYITGNPN